MPIVTLAALCNEVQQDAGRLTNIIGILEGITILDEGPADLWLTGVARVYAEDVGEYPFRAVIVAPSGKVVSTDFRLPLRFDAPESTQQRTLDLHLRTEEEGTHWLQVSIGTGAPTRVPLGVRWAPDVRRAR